MDPPIIGLLGLLVLFLLLAFGVPIAWSLGIAGFLGLLALWPIDVALSSLFQLAWGKAGSYSLCVIPMFIFMGVLAFEAGVAANVYEVGFKWFGRLPGGLAITTVFACASFAAVTGSSIAAAATIGKVAIPEMRRYGYDTKLAVGSVAASGTLGVLIPPSIILVVYGILTELSIGKLLIAGILPGLLSALIYMGMIVIRVKLNPSLGAPARPFSWGERLRCLSKMFGVLFIFVIVIGGIYLGITTPTESGALGCLLAAILLLIKAKDRGKAFLRAIWETVNTIGMIFAIIIGVTFFVAFISLSRIPTIAAGFLVALPLPNLAILLLLLLLFIPLGMFLDPLGIIFITMPIVFPAILALGYDGIWFGIIVTKLIEVGLITPPVGLNVFVIKGVAPDVELEDIYRGITWFLVMDILTIAILVAFPQISLWLPSTMY